MSLISDSKVYRSKETVCNNSTRNCVVNELTLLGKAGQQVSISRIGIDIANENDGVISTCYITVEAEGNEKLLGKWSNSKAAYTPRNATPEYTAPMGTNVKIRVYLKTEDKNYKALVRNFLGTWEYIIPGDEEDETEQDVPDVVEMPVVETEAYIIVRCASSVVDSLKGEIQKIEPGAKITILSEKT